METIAIEPVFATLLSENETIANRTEAALQIIEGNMYHRYGPALDFLIANTTPEDKNSRKLYYIGFASWVSKMADECVTYTRRALAVMPENQQIIYNLLTMNYLTSGNYTDAFLMASAGIANCKDASMLLAKKNLAQYLMQGIKAVSFNFHEKSYSFRLNCFNGQAMDTSLNHVCGTLAEPEELLYLPQFVGSCDTIVEVGVLVGNHTSFFMKNLSPKKIILIDANADCLNYAEENAKLNADGAQVEIKKIHSGVGNETGVCEIAYCTVEVNPLDVLIDEPFDFLKIDVDGWEIETLTGARKIIEKYRPKVMIEIKKMYQTPFEEFIKSVNYRVTHSLERFVDVNYFIEPNS